MCLTENAWQAGDDYARKAPTAHRDRMAHSLTNTPGEPRPCRRHPSLIITLLTQF